MNAFSVLLASVLIAGCSSGRHDDGPLAGSAGSRQGSGQSGRGGSGASGASNGDDGRGGSAGMAGAGGSTTAGSSAGGSSAPGPAACMGKTTSHRSGSRVRLKRATTSEGDVAYVGFYDRERGVDCFFARASDGMMRCLPSPSRPGQRYFADASCSDAVYGVPRSCLVEYVHVRESGPEPCADLGSTVYHRGDEYTGKVYMMSPSGCMPASLPMDLRAYRLGAEVPASELAAGTQARRGDTWIAMDVVEGEGGLRVARAWRDSKLDETCVFMPLADGKQHCVNLATQSRYADGKCQQPLFQLRGSFCEPSTYGVQSVGGRCSRPQLFKITEAFTGTQYASTGGQCMPAKGAAGADLYSATPVEPSEVPAAESVIAMDDAGRLKPSYYTSEDGGCWFRSWHDMQLDLDCRFELNTDGKAYCQPSGRFTQLVSGFSDAACTQPAFYMGTTAACDGDAPHVVLHERDTVPTSCDIATPRRVMGPPIAAADLKLYVQAAAGCQRFTPSEEVYYPVGPRMALGELVAGVISVE